MLILVAKAIERQQVDVRHVLRQRLGASREQAAASEGAVELAFACYPARFDRRPNLDVIARRIIVQGIRVVVERKRPPAGTSLASEARSA
jgi:hypothetical protein